MFARLRKRPMAMPEPGTGTLVREEPASAAAQAGPSMWSPTADAQKPEDNPAAASLGADARDAHRCQPGRRRSGRLLLCRPPRALRLCLCLAACGFCRRVQAAARSGRRRALRRHHHGRRTLRGPQAPGPLYCRAGESWDTVILQIFSPDLLAAISVQTVPLANEDIRSGQIRRTQAERVAEMSASLSRIRVPFAIEARDYRRFHPDRRALGQRKLFHGGDL